MTDVVARAALALETARTQLKSDQDWYVTVPTAMAISGLVGVIPDLIEEIARLRELKQHTNGTEPSA